MVGKNKRGRSLRGISTERQSNENVWVTRLHQHYVDVMGQVHMQAKDAGRHKELKKIYFEFKQTKTADMAAKLTQLRKYRTKNGKILKIAENMWR